MHNPQFIILMSSIFTKIIRREVPAYIVAEDNKHIAFLDIRPVVTGHTLVVPKEEIDQLFDLDDSALSELMVFAKKVAHAIQQAIPCLRIGVAVLGLEVAHAHVHLLPIQHEGDFNLHRRPLAVTPEVLQEIAKKIRSQFAR